MDFWDANFLKNIGYSVLASFNASKKKKNSGYFATPENIISRNISRCTFTILVLYGYKLLLTRYVGLKIRKNVKFSQISIFSHPPLPPLDKQ